MVSIIIVVKNGANTIEESILSVINQDYNDKELIIVDGVSTDGTMSIIMKYRKAISILISEPDKGIYDAMNKGILASNGEWIYFLGSDDKLYEKSTLNKVFSNEITGFEVIYGNVKFQHSGEIYDGEYNFDKLCLRSPCHQAVFYRRYLFDKFGYFNTQYKTASDYMLHVRTFCAGVKWGFINQIIAEYNEEGASSISKNDKAYHNQLFAFCYDNFSSKVTDLTLSRIFYSTFPRFFVSHKFNEGFKYLMLIIKKIGFFSLITNFFILFYRYKVLNAKD